MCPDPEAVKVMKPAEAEAFIIYLLSTSGPMTTMDIERAASVGSLRCPDQTVMFLMKMRQKRLICGEVSLEKRGWLWSLP